MNRCLALAGCCVLLPLWLSASAATAAETWQLESTAGGAITAPNAGNEQTSCLVGDLDGDGRMDIVVGERTAAPSVTVFFRRAAGWERSAVETGPLPIEAGGALADIDGDGRLDICFAGDWRSNQIWWWRNPGPPPYLPAGWTRRSIKNTGANMHHDLAFGDVNGDGLPDIFVAEIHTPGAGGAARSRNFRNQGGGAFTASTISTGLCNHESRLADVDGDGRLDVVGKPYTAGAPGLNVWLQRVDGTSSAGDSAAADGIWGPLSPNPFNAHVTFTLTLAQTEALSLVVYDLNGRRVRVLAAGETVAAGPQMFTWNGMDDGGRHCASGAYFVRAMTADASGIRKIMLVTVGPGGGGQPGFVVECCTGASIANVRDLCRRKSYGERARRLPPDRSRPSCCG